MNDPETPGRPGAEADGWVRQMQTLEDLAMFVGEHGPTGALPLPVVNWTLGAFHTASATLAAPFDPDPLAVLHAYALALAVDVNRRVWSNKTVYTVRGRIGRLEGQAREPRTHVVLQATVFADEPDQDNDGSTP